MNNALVKLTETSEAQSREHLAALKEQLNGLQKSYRKTVHTYLHVDMFTCACRNERCHQGS